MNVNMSLIDTYSYHAYVYGTSLWYFLRASCRIINPRAVIGWFRPPIDRLLEANDLEVYTTRTDALTLLTLAAILLVLADAVPLPLRLVGSTLTSRDAPATSRKPYARAIIILTIFHHVTTAIGAYTHWAVPSHRTVAMDIGVWVNIGLTGLGVLALVYGVGVERKGVVVGSVTSPRKTK